MRQTWAICKAELSQLFFSPIAWLIIIIFSFQSYQAFTYGISNFADQLDMFGGVDNVTYGLLTRHNGLYKVIMDNLYMFIPLLTMGLMSKEMSSGSVKLLYSSPVTPLQMISGKFLSMVMFSFIMVGVIFPALIFMGFCVPNADFGLIFSGLTAVFLLFWAYAAIGLFMSCLTSYQIVAALLTLGTLGFLNKLSNMGQEIDFVRDITYWASLSGRTEQLTEGLVSSEDILYFILVIALFLCFSIFLLQYRKNPHKGLCAAKYAGATVLVLAAGYLTSRPFATFYHDASQVGANTLTKNSIGIVKAIDGNLDITTYVNLADYDGWTGAPVTVNDDHKRYKTYMRFKHDISMNYVYYYDTPYHNPDCAQNSLEEWKDLASKYAEGFGVPWKKVLTPEQIRERIDLSGEQNNVVKQITDADGNKTWLRLFDDMAKYPDEQEITTALYRLGHKAPLVGFLTGHNERSIGRSEDGDYSGFSSSIFTRSALVNIGFDICEVSADTAISADILVIADIRKPLTESQMANVLAYLDNGGDLVLAFEPQRSDLVLPLLSYLGVWTLPGTMIYPGSETAPTLMPAKMTDYASELSRFFPARLTVSMPTVASIDYDLASEWDAVPVLAAPGTACWNETEVADFSAVTDATELSANRAAGEFAKSHSLAIALTRNVAGAADQGACKDSANASKLQKVMVIGDADCLSNVEMTIQRKTLKAFNQAFCTGIFNWMSDNALPVEILRKDPIDNGIDLTPTAADRWSIVFKWGIQVLLALLGCWIILRRQRR